VRPTLTPPCQEERTHGILVVTILRIERAAGWNLEEMAYYPRHIIKSGMPAIQTTIRYTQVSREQVKDKLKLLDQ